MMAAQIPTSMRAIALTTYGTPDTYNIASLPTPVVTKPDDVLIKVDAASINPLDVKTANGLLKQMKKARFPLKIGLDAAGTVAAIGTGVTAFNVGDKVYSRVPDNYGGTVAEYALSSEYAVAKSPSNLDSTQAAAMPLAALTAFQSLKKADAKLGGLKGKTVLVTAGLGGTGHFALQLAKNVFGVGKIITTLSTGKIEQAKQLLGDTPTVQLVDYTKENVITAVGRGTVDYLFDTTASTISYAPVVKKGGAIISISTVPSGNLMAKRGAPNMPFYIHYLLNFVNWFFTFWMGRSKIQYEYLFMEPDGKSLKELAQYVEEGRITPIVGRTAKFSDIEAVREGCQQIYDGKGGIGKFVIELD